MFQEFDRQHQDIVSVYRTHLISAVQVRHFASVAVIGKASLLSVTIIREVQKL